MSQSPHGTTFLPLTMAAAITAETSLVDPPMRRGAKVVRQQAEATNQAASNCWTALLAGCDEPSRKALVGRLYELVEATMEYAGTSWWFGSGTPYRHRIEVARDRIVIAIQDDDGAEFAEAFIGYDQAVATVLVCVQSQMGTSKT